MKYEFSRQIVEKKNPTSRFMKGRPVAAELFHVDERTDGWTDMTRLIFVLAMLQTNLIIIIIITADI